LRNLPEDKMSAKLRIVLLPCAALILSACGSGPQSLIVGKWDVVSAKAAGVDAGFTEVGKAIKMSAEFGSNGTASVTMLGHTMQGTYKLNGPNELEWSMGGITTKARVNVTETELQVTDDSNRTIKYKRK
jgi:hypothetical protein